MLKSFFIFLLSVLLFYSCSKKEKDVIKSEPDEEQIVIAIYAEAVEALKDGDAYYAGKNLKRLKVCCLKVSGQQKQV